MYNAASTSADEHNDGNYEKGFYGEFTVTDDNVEFNVGTGTGSEAGGNAVASTFQEEIMQSQ